MGARAIRRFIPMHMGNTSHYLSPIIFITVYPHAYGEHANTNQSGRVNLGLSPCIWGTLSSGMPSSARIRFIPMHMGNTDEIERVSTDKTVYPHAYGEHSNCHNVSFTPCGLSPCIWGTLFINPITFIHTRFIPMHMGNTKMMRLK